jgi:hypothetical protein
MVESFIRGNNLPHSRLPANELDPRIAFHLDQLPYFQYSPSASLIGLVRCWIQVEVVERWE